MKKAIIKVLRENSLGKATAVIDSLDLGVYIWRKELFVLKDCMDLDFDELTKEEQEDIYDALSQGKFYASKTYQG